MSCTYERGSAFVIILVAIALFAALSYAMMRDSGSGTAARTMTDAQARLYATEIIAYGDSVRQAVQKLRIRGVQDIGIGFDNDIYLDKSNSILLMPPGHNPNCAEDYCKVFSAKGGGINPSISHDQNHKHWHAILLNMNGVGTNTSDLVFVNYDVKREICSAINNILGIENPNGLPPSFPSVAILFYHGQAFPTNYDLWGNIPSLHGKRSFCYTLQNANEHKFYNYLTVLIVR